MEGIKVIIFVIVGVIWLGIWITKMFRNAFNQPAATHKKPIIAKPPTSLEEMLRQHLPKTEQEILERSEPKTARTLEVPEGSRKSLEVQKLQRKSLETLKPMGRSQESVLGESVVQREDIVRRRREKNIYQASDKRGVSVYAKMLRNPESARNAVVLAEILKRKF